MIRSLIAIADWVRRQYRLHKARVELRRVLDEQEAFSFRRYVPDDRFGLRVEEDDEFFDRVTDTAIANDDDRRGGS